MGISAKTHARTALAAFVVGVIALSSALAGIVVSPGADDLVPDPREVAAAGGIEPLAASDTQLSLDPDDVAEVLAANVRAPKGERTPDGTFLAGAARVSLAPAPTLFGGARWEREACTALDDGNIEADHLIPPVEGDPVTTVDEIRGWPASSPDCIYLGGFGIGPARPARSLGDGGVWVRAVAISNGERTFVYAIGDLVGWFSRYDQTICVDCGIRDVRDRIASEIGVPLAGLMIGSTHTHAGADTYGGWGGIPSWYRNQIRDSAIAAVKQAVANLAPSTLHSGTLEMSERNNERRDHYYSTVDTGLTWIQARPLGTDGGCATGSDAAAVRRRPRPRRTPTPEPTKRKRTPRPSPTQTPNATPTSIPTPTICVPDTDAIATIATYAAHPTIVGDPILHADWPGATARTFEDRYGGVGLTFEGGLGNASVSTVGQGTEPERAEQTGRAIADAAGADIAANDGRIASNDMVASIDDALTHPVATNLGLATLATVGLFDREFVPGTPGAGVPGAYHWTKGGAVDPEPGSLRGCSSAGRP
ncbi:MAG: hypothetical protein WD826_00775 [Actinomycetota bacterium]